MKKIISSILIPSFLFYCFGCYSTMEITKDEFVNHNDQKAKTFLLTKEKERYQLDELQYFVKRDTIYAYKGSKIVNETETPFLRQKPLLIPIDNVDTYKLSELNKTSTWLVIGGVLIASMILLTLYAPKKEFKCGDYSDWWYHYPLY
ncbi:MAG TPA: hypothetical protein VMT35_13445 [Ignavibacteriaceae bacterium]|nr:hypothetical protein [Ignavibacteriaceae bacterium]